MSTGIEWTDETWNPIKGCSRTCAAGTKQSGCGDGSGGGCYAEQQAGRIVLMDRGRGVPEGQGSYDGLVRLTSGGWRWTGKTAFDARRLADPLKWKKPRRVFVDSMSDLFHDGFTNEQIAAVFGVMAAAPQHTFQVLTKRARRMREWFEWVSSSPVPYDSLPVYDDYVRQRQVCCRHAWMLPDSEDRLNRGEVYGLHPSDAVLEYQRGPWPLPNVILGVSVENRAALERLDDLRACPAALRFVSAEPLLEDLGKIDLSDIGWLIAGCESGPKARPCPVDALRGARDQCAEAGVAFFLKQAHFGPGIGMGPGSKRKPGGIYGAPLLDDVQHLAFPEVRA